MVKRKYIPDRGDLVWLDFNPQKGHEQAGTRPALTISPKSYNEKVGLGLFCPVTTRKKGYPFEVNLSGVKKISGVVLSDQIKSFDWKARNLKFIEKIKVKDFEDVIAKIGVLIFTT
ncbi:endoribonuclease MazF [Candidatus Riflebacteria bacterium]